MNKDKLNLIGGLQLQPQLDPLTGHSGLPLTCTFGPFLGLGTHIAAPSP